MKVVTGGLLSFLGAAPTLDDPSVFLPSSDLAVVVVELEGGRQVLYARPLPEELVDKPATSLHEDGLELLRQRVQELEEDNKYLRSETTSLKVTNNQLLIKLLQVVDAGLAGKLGPGESS